MLAAGTVVVITGASSGIGRAVGLAFAHRGARLVLAARSAEALSQVARECTAAHPQAEAVAVPADVTDADAMTGLADTALARYGRVDVWVNAAGVGVLGRLDAVPPADVLRSWEVNVLGTLHGARAALRVMRGQGRGVLIDVSSVLGGAVTAPYMGAYAAAKAALVVLDEVMRQELIISGDHDVAVCTVLPAGVDTPFFQHSANHTGRRVRTLPAVATPERVARAVLHTAARPRARVVVGPGARLLPWAHALAPGLVRGLIRRRTEHGYLGAPGTAPVTTGTLYAPSGATAAVSGDRHAAARTAARRAFALAAAGAVGARFIAARSRTRVRTGSPTHVRIRPRARVGIGSPTHVRIRPRVRVGIGSPTRVRMRPHIPARRLSRRR
ncbi:SDR family NAD(P)-dependent oxidoreductase [Streptomyces wedmorensis]|uniref:SDR family NAD(P)-dependent oxidoreductase n=1 Tax=Streptomyces wedmorensis TaxID=43759 RepID=A0ABW6J186_STRWE